MSASLTTLISNIQALLLDDGTRFTTATCTAALRQALKDFNLAAPIHAGTLMDVVSGQKEYALNAADFTNLITVLDVLRQGTDTHLEYNLSLNFDPYFEDAAPFIRLRTAESSGYLIVRFTIPYTVNGLDSAVESTLPALFDPILVDGCAYYALVIRKAGRIEQINLNPDVENPLEETAKLFKLAFDTGLAFAGRRKPPVSEPDTRAWNDKWHGWQ